MEPTAAEIVAAKADTRRREKGREGSSPAWLIFPGPPLAAAALMGPGEAVTGPAWALDWSREMDCGPAAWSWLGVVMAGRTKGK